MTNSTIRSDVELTTGTLRGEIDDTVRSYRGVPYAAPPVGKLRFAPPRPPEPWSGVRSAMEFRSPAPQPSPSVGQQAGERSHSTVGDEDCLYLNVYCPAAEGSYPVVVWIHGGVGIYGSASEFDPRELVETGVVVVSIAYRLGALGLLYLPDVFDDGPGCNFAMLDQTAALRWVSENIAAFGGDPDRVTIAGESAGARAVSHLLAAPGAAGLFTQAIAMSGTCLGQIAFQPAEAEHVTAEVLRKLGLEIGAAGRLRELPAEQIVEAQTRVAEESGMLLPFSVVIDGAVLPERPLDAVSRGVAREIPLIVGSTNDEYDGFELESDSDDTKPATPVAETETEQMVRQYRELLPADWDDKEVSKRVLTDANWWLPAIRFAEAQIAAGGKAWMCRFDWRIAPRGHGIGAAHGLDPGVMGAPDPVFEPLIAAQGRGPSYDVMAAKVRAELAHFLTTGEALEDWPRFDSVQRPTMIFDDSSRLVRDPDRELRRVWSGVE